MATYYLDIETTGLDERHSKIITIQYQELERGTGRAAGDLTILKEWEMGESGMLEHIERHTPILNDYPFDFIAVGYNLGFEHKFLQRKTRQHGLPEINLLSRPCVDLHGVGILMNHGEFKGSGLDKMTGKKESGGNVPAWYGSGDHSLIENYIKNETREFLKWHAWLVARMPKVREEWDGVMSARMGPDP